LQEAIGRENILECFAENRMESRMLFQMDARGRLPLGQLINGRINDDPCFVRDLEETVDLNADVADTPGCRL
jgi:hypothetical protein